MAERSAADQVKELLEAAERIRADAERDATLVGEAAARLAEHGQQLERRLDELAAGVRDAIAELRADVAALRDAATPPPEEDPATRVEADADDELIAEAEAVAGRVPEPEQPEEAPAEPSPSIPDGARLLALKMALDGRPREETAGYLRENFELDDPEALLDEVYSRAGG